MSTDQIRNLAPSPYLIDDLLVADSLAVLFGKPASGKSFLALDWAFCVATGRPWKERSVAQGKVLFIVGEGVSGVGKRLRAWEHDNDCSVGDDISWLTIPPTLLEGHDAETLIELAVEYKPSLIVVDTLARCMPGGEENSSKDMSAVVDALDRLRQSTGATVLLVHHTTKDGGSLRGHSSLSGAVQTSVGFSVRSEVATLVVEKQKDDAAGMRISLKLREVIDSCVLDAVVLSGASRSVAMRPKASCGLWARVRESLESPLQP